MKVLILGSEDANIHWPGNRTEPAVTELFIAPGNAGTKELGTNINIDTQDFKGIGEFAVSHELIWSSLDRRHLL